MVTPSETDIAVPALLKVLLTSITFPLDSRSSEEPGTPTS